MEVPSTTTIINKYKDMGGLMHFAWAEGKAGRGLTESRDRAGDVGSMLHGMIDAHIKQAVYSHPVTTAKDEDFTTARKLFETFVVWWGRAEMKVIASETSLVSERHQYGGTIDLVATCPLGTGPIIMDWKTSKDYYQEMLLQMAAYRALWREYCGVDITAANLMLFSKTSRKITIYPVTAAQMDLAFDKFLLLRKAYDMEAPIAEAVKETRDGKLALSYDHGN